MQNPAISLRNTIKGQGIRPCQFRAHCKVERNLPKAFHNTAASNFSSWNDFYASAITGLKERHEPSKQFSPAAP
jgi:hypothetical protein